MNQNGSHVHSTGVQYLGELMAALSHDLKNVLAIVNENAGLLEDLAYMATEEAPIDPQRLATVAGKIRHQVRRGDEMIKRVNQVGHSVDRPLAPVNVAELVVRMGAMAERKAAMKGVAFTISPSSKETVVPTQPFLLSQLIWRCLNGLLKMGPKPGTIEISIESSDNEVTILFGPMLFEAEINTTVTDWYLQELLEKLNSNLNLNRDTGTLTIRLPCD